MHLGIRFARVKEKRKNVKRIPQDGDIVELPDRYVLVADPTDPHAAAMPKDAKRELWTPMIGWKFEKVRGQCRLLAADEFAGTSICWLVLWNGRYLSAVIDREELTLAGQFLPTYTELMR